MQIGQDLPDGAELESVNDVISDAPNADDAYGSIRPSAKTVGERVPRILERGRIIVGVAQSLNRLAFRDPATGDMAGFEVDIAREIARDIFGDPDAIEFRFVETVKRDEALASGEMDVVIRTMTVDTERQKHVEFSIPYLRVREQLLVQQNSGFSSFDDLASKTVCTSSDSTATQSVRRFKIDQLLTTRTWTDCLLAMQRHQTDAIFTDNAILSGLQAQDPSTELVGDDWRDHYYAVAVAPPGVPRNTRGLVEQVNSTLERIRTDGTWQRLYNQWMATYLGDASPNELPTSYRTDAESAELFRERQRTYLEHQRERAAESGTATATATITESGSGSESTTDSTRLSSATSSTMTGTSHPNSTSSSSSSNSTEDSDE